jgi:hypothetical protein
MSPGFQFSLSKMLRATAWFAVICVALAALHRTLVESPNPIVYWTRTFVFSALMLLSAVLAMATFARNEKIGYLVAFWILALLIAMLAIFLVVRGGHQRMRLTM